MFHATHPSSPPSPCISQYPYIQGDSGDAMYIIMTGKAKILIKSEEFENSFNKNLQGTAPKPSPTFHQAQGKRGFARRRVSGVRESLEGEPNSPVGKGFSKGLMSVWSPLNTSTASQTLLLTPLSTVAEVSATKSPQSAVFRHGSHTSRTSSRIGQCWVGETNLSAPRDVTLSSTRL
eukprot:1185567-Prorocentrum_minimum.AAC.2